MADYSLPQVTIVSPDPGAASGKIAGTQGDMEKADMVDGALAQRDNYVAPACLSIHVLASTSPAQLL